MHYVDKMIHFNRKNVPFIENDLQIIDRCSSNSPMLVSFNVAARRLASRRTHCFQ